MSILSHFAFIILCIIEKHNQGCDILMQGRTFTSSMKKEPKYSLPRLSLNSSNRQKLGGKLSKINYITISKYTKKSKT